MSNYERYARAQRGVDAINAATLKSAVTAVLWPTKDKKPKEKPTYTGTRPVHSISNNGWMLRIDVFQADRRVGCVHLTANNGQSEWYPFNFEDSALQSDVIELLASIT